MRNALSQCGEWVITAASVVAAPVAMVLVLVLLIGSFAGGLAWVAGLWWWLWSLLAG